MGDRSTSNCFLDRPILKYIGGTFAQQRLSWQETRLISNKVTTDELENSV